MKKLVNYVLGGALLTTLLCFTIILVKITLIFLLCPNNQ